MEKGVKQIKVTLTTGDVRRTSGAALGPNHPAAGARYLGIGGREFLLEYGGDIEMDQFAFTRGKVDTFILGAEIGDDIPNTPFPEFNDPRRMYIMTEEYLDKFETYLRYEPARDQNTGADYWWRLDNAVVDVTLSLGNLTFIEDGQEPSGTVRYTTLTREGIGGDAQVGDSLWLSSRTSEYVYLKREEALDDGIQHANIIQKIVVRARTSPDTAEHGSSATGSRVWLGIGGREFYLETDQNDFTTDHEDEFIFGQNSNVQNRLLNDPRGPGPGQSSNYPIAQEYLDIYPVYLRFERAPGQDPEWRVENVHVKAYKKRNPTDTNNPIEDDTPLDLLLVREYRALKDLQATHPTPTTFDEGHVDNPMKRHMLMNLGNSYLFLKRTYDLDI